MSKPQKSKEKHSSPDDGGRGKPDDHAGRGHEKGPQHDRQGDGHGPDVNGECKVTDTPPTTDEGCVKWTLTAGDVVVEVSASLNDAGEVVFSYDLISGTADLNGFYVDLDNDGGSIRKLEGGNNMNGSDSDGDKLDGFDWAAIIGTVGGNDADTTSGSVTVSMAELGITSLADLDGAEIGIRATSVGEDREDSLKLADTGTYCEPEEPEEPVDLCDRPIDGENVDGKIAMQDNQITEISVAYYIAPTYDEDGNGPFFPGDTNDDVHYVVTVSVPAEMGEDPDAYLEQLLSAIAAADPNVQENSLVKSVIITDCHGNQQNYAIAFDANGELTDTLSDGLFGVLERDGGELPADLDLAYWLDATYDLTLSGDEFLFA